MAVFRVDAIGAALKELKIRLKSLHQKWTQHTKSRMPMHSEFLSLHFF